LLFLLGAIGHENTVGRFRLMTSDAKLLSFLKDAVRESALLTDRGHRVAEDVALVTHSHRKVLIILISFAHRVKYNGLLLAHQLIVELESTFL